MFHVLLTLFISRILISEAILDEQILPNDRVQSLMVSLPYFQSIECELLLNRIVEGL